MSGRSNAIVTNAEMSFQSWPRSRKDALSPFTQGRGSQLGNSDAASGRREAGSPGPTPGREPYANGVV